MRTNPGTEGRVLSHPPSEYETSRHSTCITPRVRIYSLILSLFLVVAGSAFAHEPDNRRPMAETVECPEWVSLFATEFDKLAKGKSHWKILPESKIRFAIKDDQAYFFGFSKQEMLKANIQHRACKNATTVWVPLHADALLMKAVTEIYLPTKWAMKDRFEYAKKHPLAEGADMGFMAVDLPEMRKNSNQELVDRFLAPEVLANAAAHESFHIVQIRDFTNLLSPWDNPPTEEELRSLPGLEEEIRKWKEIRGNLASENHARVRELISEVLNNRRRPQARDPWPELERLERVEGVAHHYGVTLSRSAGIARGGEIDGIYGPRGFDFKNPEVFDRGTLFVYPTGALQCEALEALFGDRDWQKEIIEGKTPAQVLRKYLGLTQ